MKIGKGGRSGEMSRLTARTETGHAYLVNVKNTLQCILDCFERLAQYEDATEEHAGSIAVRKFVGIWKLGGVRDEH